MDDKPRRLSEVLDTHAPQGANDRHWFLVEHQLIQVNMSMQTVIDTLWLIGVNPENAVDKLEADDCLAICRDMALDIKEHYAQFLSYLSDTDVPERISRKEL